MRPLVVDGSAAIAWVASEPERERVDDLVGAHGSVLVPWFFWLEVVNVLARRHLWSGSKITAAVHDLEQLGLQTEAPSRPMLLATIDAVETHRLTAYDATYLVLAESADADLLTGDAFLAAAAGSRAILVGQRHRLAEERARYEAGRREEPDWPRWPGAAAYVEELRREVLADQPGRPLSGSPR